MAFIRQLHRFHPKACPENSIKCGRCSAALQMAKDAGARLLAGASGNLSRHQVTDSTQAKFTTFHITFNLPAIFGLGTLGYDHERTQVPGSVTLFNGGRNLVIIKWDFRNQNNIGATCEPPV